MIWENKTTLIVMVCPEQGPKGEECINYWNNLKEIGDTTSIDNIFSLKLIDI